MAKKGTKSGKTRKARKPRATRKSAGKKGGKAVSKSGNGVPRKSIDVRKLRQSAGLSLVKFAKKIGASVGSVQNWEKDTTPGPSYLAKLKAFAAETTSGAAGAHSQPHSAVAEAPKKRGRLAKVDVKALRASLGMSMAAFGKKLGGASVGSIANWERGTSPQTKYAVRLRDLAAKVASGTATASAAGTPSTASAIGASRASGDHQSLARMLFEAGVGCSEGTRAKLFEAAAALLAE